LYASVSVLQVGGCVAIHGHHFVEVKLIVARPILRKVGVFDGPDTDDFGHLGPFIRAQFRAVFIDHTASDLNGFVEDSGETDCIAFARLQGSAGLVEDGSEGNVAEVDFIKAPGLGDGRGSVWWRGR
jgi:hypothetical protein